jgi:hypothetical protein
MCCCGHRELENLFVRVGGRAGARPMPKTLVGPMVRNARGAVGPKLSWGRWPEMLVVA